MLIGIINGNMILSGLNIFYIFQGFKFYNKFKYCHVYLYLYLLFYIHKTELKLIL